ncbi:MAG TPA: TetR/AcrR family transcriptional regulator [Candidatus Sulfotelmatobacter sp.]|nr:TetR/AcrR family transcriptional regulator [Candidatus Sulfotelmatobacter sp.]
MPRRPDPDLEGKILDAAQKLWKKGGEKALTMRTVARAAGTNTPAVYRRFRDRNDILRGLLQRIRWDIASQMEGISSPEEGCERYLDYALRHPREYELFFQKEYELFYSVRSIRAGFKPKVLPVRDVMRQKVTEKLGGSPDDHERLLLALRMVVHGAAMLLIEKAILPEDAAEARAVLTATVAALLNPADGLGDGGKR